MKMPHTASQKATKFCHTVNLWNILPIFKTPSLAYIEVNLHYAVICLFYLQQVASFVCFWQPAMFIV